ncbi:Uncharacterised protein [Mycobacteroides abscessus subsp. abscessus]|nr:Uncharacterised protein [Mycobacteroides abscessus subsp. abscessus]
MSLSGETPALTATATDSISSRETSATTSR